MRNKTPLVLMELAVMLLVFSIGAALCLGAFSWAHSTSQSEAQRDQACLQIQNAAEALKHFQGDFAAAAEYCGGVWDGSQWRLLLDENWQRTASGGSYILQAEPQSTDTEYLGMARLEIRDTEGTVLASVNVGWQEVAP